MIQIVNALKKVKTIKAIQMSEYGEALRWGSCFSTEHVQPLRRHDFGAQQVDSFQ